MHQRIWGLHGKRTVLQWNTRATYNAVMVPHLIFMTQGTLLIEHPSWLRLPWYLNYTLPPKVFFFFTTDTPNSTVDRHVNHYSTQFHEFTDQYKVKFCDLLLGE
jgi:hypothetical protein